MNTGIARERGEVTRLLAAWRTGDMGARDDLMQLVYRHVHDLAATCLRGQQGASALTMRPTELSHELFLHLLGDDTEWKDRRHFFGVAVVAMRRILVDAARARASSKRGAGAVHVSLSSASNVAAEVSPAQALDAALSLLREQDARTCEVIELTHLLGLTREEVARTLDVSVATVDRELRFGRAWLQRELNP